jgi:Ca-activated chloride channel family protein
MMPSGLKKGNVLYEKKSYDKALKEYSKATQKNPTRFEGQFNEGDALYKAGKYEEALSKFSSAGSLAKTKEQQASVQHNIGNTHIQSKKYAEGVEAYKKALTLSPNDDKTRYNLAYAQKMLQQQQKQQKNDQNKGDSKDQKDQKDSKGDSKDQKDQNKDSKKSEDQKQDQNKESESKNQQASKPQMSKEDADRMLQAIQKSRTKFTGK